MVLYRGQQLRIEVLEPGDASVHERRREPRYTRLASVMAFFRRWPSPSLRVDQLPSCRHQGLLGCSGFSLKVAADYAVDEGLVLSPQTGLSRSGDSQHSGLHPSSGLIGEQYRYKPPQTVSGCIVGTCRRKTPIGPGPHGQPQSPGRAEQRALWERGDPRVCRCSDGADSAKY